MQCGQCQCQCQLPTLLLVLEIMIIMIAMRPSIPATSNREKTEEVAYFFPGRMRDTCGVSAGMMAVRCSTSTSTGGLILI